MDSTSENRAILAFESCPIGSITSRLKKKKKVEVQSMQRKVCSAQNHLLNLLSLSCAIKNEEEPLKQC